MKTQVSQIFLVFRRKVLELSAQSVGKARFKASREMNEFIRKIQGYFVCTAVVARPRGLVYRSEISETAEQHNLKWAETEHVLIIMHENIVDVKMYMRRPYIARITVMLKM